MADNLSEQQSRELIRQIRRDNAVDEDLCRSAQRDPDVWRSLQNIKTQLGNSIDLLSRELYSRPAHFLLEVVQNADDCSYGVSISPELRIKLRKTHMEIQCNEVGFAEDNVRAFCAIGKSTKKGRSGYIGEKGIGAKSMFKVANQIHVHSRNFHFMLDSREELGMISPKWDTSDSFHTDWTTMRLDFSDDDQVTTVRKQVQLVQDSILLFMRQLASLHIDDGISLCTITREIAGDILTIRIQKPRTTYLRYLRIAETVAAYAEEKKREGATTTELILAFPLNADLEPLRTSQMAYAFLPMRNFGFNFIIQGDFLTAANREDILTELAWNTTIRNSISRVFLAAFDKFCGYPKLRFTWPRFVPRASDVPSAFFRTVVDDIRSVLSNKDVIICRDANLRRMSCVKLPAEYSLGGEPLVPERQVPFYYVSRDYPADVVTLLRDIGVQDMTIADFLTALSAMSRPFHSRSHAWVEQASLLLYNNGFSWQRWSQQYQPNDGRIRALCIAPLLDGRWLPCTASDTLFFASDQSSFPQNLDINIVRVADKARYHRKLLERLGVRDITPSEVVRKIIAKHRSSSSELDRATLLRHALYVFKHRASLPSDLASDLQHLRLSDTYGRAALGSELYMDGREYAVPLSSVLGSYARFLHNSFLAPLDSEVGYLEKAEWQTFLQTRCGVATIPRVVDGHLDTPLRSVIEEWRTSNPAGLLDALKQYWPTISAQLSSSQRATVLDYLGGRAIKCSNGNIVPMRSTYLLSNELRPFVTTAMPLLPISAHTGAADWEFLRDFGVSTSVDAAFFLKRLSTLAQSSDVEASAVAELYEHIAARFHEIPDTIRSAFKSMPLFFIGKDWKGWEDVYWDGPSILTVRSQLAHTYPNMRRFFCDYLLVVSAPPTIVADELRRFIEEKGVAALDEKRHKRLVSILQYADSTISNVKDRSAEDWLAEVRDLAFLPIRRPDGTVVLSSCDGDFYVSDLTGSFEDLFHAQFSFLALPGAYPANLPALVDFLDLDAKRLERCVIETVHINNVQFDANASHWPGTPNIDDTAIFQSRVYLLQWLQINGSHSAVEQEDVALVQSVTVVDVNTVEATYTVRGVSGIEPVVTSLPCFIAETVRGHLGLLVISSSSKPAIAAEMTRQLGLSVSRYMSLVKDILFNGDEADLLETLRLAGIRRPDQQVLDRLLRASAVPGRPLNGIHATAGTTMPSIPSETVSQNYTLQRFRPDAASPSSATSLFKSSRSRRSRTARKASTPVPTLPASPIDPLVAYLSTPAGQTEIARVESIAAKANVPTAKVFRHLHSHGRAGFTGGGNCTSENDGDDNGDDGSDSDATAASPTLGFPSMHTGLDEELIIIGFLGETFVYTLLKSILPEGTFTYDNWRSVLRERAGFTPFVGQEFEDFHYLDTEGVLTKRLFPPSHRYHDARPEYFIEVKTTTHGPNEFFYMKRSQLQQAFDMSQHANPTTAGSVERLYLIFRVSNIRDERPGLTVYDDPHHLLCRGLLRIESDSVVVRVASGQHSVDHNLA
ncbi:hypothetical protein EXIGLDRAFT_797156 [Exidia glandulosa HHB12029]|uniref:Protein NO VEIN C-terminal domain-containing protein n=1 Tax=Exidia glandulosa HHB12029 TaxID=1314781 RepID=A0A165FK38_EXIGL|nr:hypothetical protein EXIGLDRAFT_797156 [Exidia glandulosa HHB12029]